MTVAERVEAAVEDLTREHAARFNASYVSKRAEADPEDSRRELLRLVERGDLTLGFEVMCPESGRTISTYSREDHVPVGETIDCDLCDVGEHVVREEDIWVTFTPTYKLSSRLGRQESPKAAPSRQRRVMRWLTRSTHTGR